MDNIINEKINILYMIPVALLSLSIHEFSHGYAAYKLGDPTAKYFGRLTMNPIKHIDPIGFITLMLFKIGWAKPVPVDPRHFKNPKRDMAITAVAGPLSNFILAFICVILHQVFVFVCLNIMKTVSVSEAVFTVITTVQTLFLLLIYSNIGLGVFNLIPIVPFDGSRILYAFLPNTVTSRLGVIERYSGIIILVLLLTGILDGTLSFLNETIAGAFFSVADMIIPLPTI